MLEKGQVRKAQLPVAGPKFVEHGGGIEAVDDVDVAYVGVVELAPDRGGRGGGVRLTAQPEGERGDRGPARRRGISSVAWRSSFDQRCPTCAFLPSAGRACGDPWPSELLPPSNASLETSGSTRLSGIRIAVAFLPSRARPVQMARSHRCRWLSRR